MADGKSAVLVEIFGKERLVKRIGKRCIATNHFKSIDFGPKNYGDYPNSFDRYAYAEEEMAEARTLKDIFSMLGPQDIKKRRKIWRNDNFFTVSSSVIDLSGKRLYYTKSADGPYQEITLEKRGVYDCGN